MILLESGAARTDRNWWLGVGLVFLVMGGYFIYDGAVGYRKQNAAKARERLSLWTAGQPELGETPGPEEYHLLRTRKVASRQELHELLGQPLAPREGAATAGVERFASVYGVITVPIDPSGRVRSELAEWQAWKWSKEEIRNQYYWGVIPCVLAVYFLIRAFRAGRLRAEIDEQGMTYGGVRIALADIASIRDYNKKGWVDLYYRRGGQEKRLRIDNQKIAKFDEIVELLCQQKKFPNPIKAYFEAQQGEDDEDKATADFGGAADAQAGVKAESEGGAGAET